MPCLVHRHTVWFSTPLLILSYLLSPVHRLSVTSQGTVTQTPPFLLKSPFFGCEAQFNWALLAWSYETLNPICNLSLPCNPHAVDLSHSIWLLYLSALSPRGFFSKGKVTLCPLITCVAKIWFIFLGWYYISLEERTFTVYPLSTWSRETLWHHPLKIHVTVKHSSFHAHSCLYSGNAVLAMPKHHVSIFSLVSFYRTCVKKCAEQGTFRNNWIFGPKDIQNLLITLIMSDFSSFILFIP